jgi:hypothetical protein
MAALAARWVESRGYERLCYARLGDHARERLGVSARQLQELARVHRALRELPATEPPLLGCFGSALASVMALVAGWRPAQPAARSPPVTADAWMNFLLVSFIYTSWLRNGVKP